MERLEYIDQLKGVGNAVSCDDIFLVSYESRNYFAILLIAILTAIPLSYLCIIGEIFIGKLCEDYE